MTTDPQPPAVNAEELHAILAEITADPERWNQQHYAVSYTYRCGTAYCVAGHAVCRAHPDARFNFYLNPYALHDAKTADNVTLSDGSVHEIHKLAAEILGLTGAEASVLFAGHNTLAELTHIVGVLTDPAYRRTLEHGDMGEMVAVR
jgi:hypothetical protein